MPGSVQSCFELFPTCLIFEISPREANFSPKLHRTREETAELSASRGILLSSFLTCAAGLTESLERVTSQKKIRN